MPRQKKTTEKKQEKSGEYKVTVSFNGNTIHVETDDVLLALSEVLPKRISTRVDLEIRKGDKAINRFLFSGHARRLFYNNTYAKAFISGIMKILNGK